MLEVSNNLELKFQKMSLHAVLPKGTIKAIWFLALPIIVWIKTSCSMKDVFFIAVKNGIKID
jgi:hypothetical protein